MIRIGFGNDIHRLVSGRNLVLGGLVIPSEKGEEAHSDGDVLIHALIDAILGSLALGDIGSWFPPTDPRWKNISSLELLKTVDFKIKEKGFLISNIDTTVILEQPRLRPHIDSIREKIADILHLNVNQVSIKAKTNEQQDSTGRGESIQAQAVVLLVKA